MKKTIWWWILIVALGAAILYVWLAGQKPEPDVLEPPPSEEPTVLYPIEPAPPTEEPAGTPAEPLPALAESDETLQEALAGLFGKKLKRYFYLKDIIHRVIATVDNLPRKELPLRLMPVKPVSGRPATAGKGEKLRLSARNAARYRPYVRLMEAVPTEALVAVYVRFYPLFQEQYEKLGYPGKYFNDRLVEVIDHLLAAPEVEGPVRLIQPKVLYEFTDPKLEELSAGQKILVRMGSMNAAKVKAKLQEIRSAIVSQGPKQ